MEGWFSLHDSYVLRGSSAEREAALAGAAAAAAAATDAASGSGWSAVVSLVGGPADVLAVHFRDSVESLEAARSLLSHALGGTAERRWSQLGATEAGLYHLTAELARAARNRGGVVGDEQYSQELERRIAAERDSDHVRRRLYPERPADMPYVSFYPMSKRRERKQNWYALTLDERSALMREHGLTGRRYAGRVLQIITGAVGFSEWEWGVTLFARDLLDVKRLVTDMRFDEVSARFAEFGEFYVGRVLSA